MTGERYYLIRILCLILGHGLETAQSHLGGPESTGQFQIHFVLEGQFDGLPVFRVIFNEYECGCAGCFSRCSELAKPFRRKAKKGREAEKRSFSGQGAFKGLAIDASAE